MNRPMLMCAFLALASTAVYGQQQQQPQQQQPASDPYQGQSHPPADDIIEATEPDQPKPPAGKPMTAPTPAPQPVTAQPAPAPQPALVDRSSNLPNDAVTGGDDGVVQIAQPASDAPSLSARDYASDPDGDIVHPHPLPPDTLQVGTMIRARLITGLSTAYSERGEEFRARVASDVLQDGQVLIPAGADIEGHITEVSEGQAGGHGSMRLRPETVVLPDGSRYRMDAQVIGTPGTNTRVNGEGVINGGSRYKKDGVEYGGAVGAGAVTGAMIAGPVGAAAGSLVGAGLVTVHLLVDHPQANLKPGTVLLFSLNNRLTLTATNDQVRPADQVN